MLPRRQGNVPLTRAPWSSITTAVGTAAGASPPRAKNLINAGRIELMRPGATFINTSRGELVDQDALLARLEGGDLYAVLDMTTPWVLLPIHRSTRIPTCC